MALNISIFPYPSLGYTITLASLIPVSFETGSLRLIPFPTSGCLIPAPI